MPDVLTHRWTRDEYDRAVDAGVFADRSPIELIDGELLEIKVTPQKPPHAYTLHRVLAALIDRYGTAAVRSQMPLALGPHDEPEPDVAVVPDGDYRLAHPTTASLVVEVSDSTLHFDRTRKALVYARAGIPTYWIVNLLDEVVEVCTHPTPDGYGEHVIFRRGGVIAEGLRVDDIL